MIYLNFISSFVNLLYNVFYISRCKATVIQDRAKVYSKFATICRTNSYRIESVDL